VRTIKGNTQIHSSVGLELDQLPLTFRDVVEVSRRLHITYVWIDSLCIIQDSDEDWRFEAASMADIYENAHITITASSAKDSTEGCFRKTHWSCVGQPLPGYPGAYIHRGPTLPSGLQQPEWPLFERGWAFQELTLFPRIIHFGNEEVIWRCRSKFSHEASLSNHDDSTYAATFSPDLSLAEGRELQEQWYNIVNAYSNRKLFFLKDR
jgi:hypothetical protein